MTDQHTAREDFAITNEFGLHFRAAAIIVRTAKGFRSRITFTCGKANADARSVLDLLTLSATSGSVVTVEAEGEDAAQAVATLGRLIRRNFAE